MESTFRGLFLAGAIGGVAWFWYVVLQPMTLLVEAAGVSIATLTLIGLVGWLYEKNRSGVRGAAARESKSLKVAADGVGANPKPDLKKVSWKVWGALAVLVVGCFGVWVYLEAMKREETDLAYLTIQVRSQCATWINREFNSGNPQLRARASDSWQKNGHIVVDVTWKDSSSSKSRNTRLCVYDPDTGRMQSPGAFGRGRWEKH
ncbi:hypothetical protein [Leisingera sp. McT4-56]|uniref:hypothetical protein n=1 Tax=Leisingera sp. McT4-56 TaxID=2881255 RepID=UPI001CF83A9A|nr:hypothetical protein [Leisingera sp. McT4-56]MCB4458534.1 hypothetical protein [Leisingera sp. McT4-56]